MKSLGGRIEGIISGRRDTVSVKKGDVAVKFAWPILAIFEAHPEEARKLRFFLANFDLTDTDCVLIATDAVDVNKAASSRHGRVGGKDAASAVAQAVAQALSLVRDVDVMTTHSHEAISDHGDGKGHRWRMLAYRTELLQYIADKMGMDMDSLDKVPRKLAKLCNKFGRRAGNVVSLGTLPMMHGVYTYTLQWSRMKTCRQCGLRNRDLADGRRLKYCSTCNRVQYCSKECQATHWRSTHKLGECRELLTMASATPGASLYRVEITLEDIAMTTPAGLEFLACLGLPPPHS